MASDPKGGRKEKTRRHSTVVEETVKVRGRERTVVRPVPGPPKLGRRRYAVVYDVEGPRVRLGVLWFAAVVGSIVLSRYLTAGLYIAMSGLAAYQAARAWADEGSGANRLAAAALGVAIPLAALFGTGPLAMMLVAGAVLAPAASWVKGVRSGDVLEGAGTTVQCALFTGMAAAGVVMTHRLEIGAVVTLVLVVSAYEVGDYLVGSGASNSVEGPIAGIVGVFVVTFIVQVLQVPPWGGTDVWAWGALAAICCPLGQLAASAVLPKADAPARAVRRLDSLILLAPAWAWTIGLYIERVVEG